jgi:hypothetical protein
MLVSSCWPNASSERAAFKKLLENELLESGIPGVVREESDWITLRQQIIPDYDGEAGKMIDWLGRAASKIDQLRASSDANKGSA